MGKEHLKRLNAPKTWNIDRKESKFITKSLPGPHKLEQGMPLNVLLKYVLKCASTTREVKKVLNSSNVKVDGKIKKDFRFPVGLFDTIELVDINEYFRIILSKKGKLDLIKINKEEVSIKPCKIIGKTMVRGKLQLNLYDGRNVLADNNTYKVGDTLVLNLPEQKISKHLKLGKKSTIFLVGGKHTGDTGNVEDVIENRIVYKNHKGEFIQTSKEYAFVVGDDKPLIKIE